MEENGDDHSRLLLAPMVKSAVLAMNATDDILHQENCGETTLNPEGKRKYSFVCLKSLSKDINVVRIALPLIDGS